MEIFDCLSHLKNINIKKFPGKLPNLDLPSDLKSFYSSTNGLLITWEHGQIDISCIEKCKYHEYSLGNSIDQNKELLLIEETTFGQVCLKQNQIWFHCIKDDSWYFIGNSFVAYLRLAICTFGIHGWQMGYTLYGLPIKTNHLMCLYCPEIAAMIRRYSAELKYKKQIPNTFKRELGILFQLEKVQRFMRPASRPSTASRSSTTSRPSTARK